MVFFTQGLRPVQGTRDAGETRSERPWGQPPAVRRHAGRRIEAIGQAGVAYVPGTIRHLWHGDRKNRQYVSRDAMLCNFAADPARHLRIDENGLLAWTTAAPAGIRKAVREYFAARREDGPAS